MLELMRRNFVYQEFQGCNRMLDPCLFYAISAIYSKRAKCIEKQLNRTSEPVSGTNPVLIEDI
jgi:hypothetical protein